EVGLSSVKGPRGRRSKNSIQNSLWTLRVSGHDIRTDQRTCSIHGPHEPGLAGYYRRFIEGFSKMAKLMTKLTQKKCSFPTSTDVFPLPEEVLTARRKLLLPEEVPTGSAK
nr:retrotransposon protein, putative, Ty3-gypsy subclass [Tanacetum cinerariifolium]